MNYCITMYSVTGISEDITFFDYAKALDKYKRQCEKLKNYKIINKIEFTEGYKHKNTFKILDKVEFNEAISLEGLSLTCYSKLNELFRCLTYGNSYFKDGEYHYNKETKEYEIDRKEEYLNDYSSANKEYDDLLLKNDEQVKKEDEIYSEIKGSYKCLVKSFDMTCNNCYFGTVTVVDRLERIKSNYRSYNYKFNGEYAFDENIPRMCKSIDYNTIFERIIKKNGYQLPKTTGTNNDSVIILSDDEYEKLTDECKSISQRIEKEKEEEEEKERLLEEEERKKAEEWKNTFKIKKEIKIVHPRGGEEGTDGYYEVVITYNESNADFHIVLRNVFDVGCWSCIFGKNYEDNLTDMERLACKWVYDHAPFTNMVRM